MLVLTRKRGERILVGDDIVITILEIKGDAIRIGVDAPSGVRIQRHEVVEAIAEANVAATAEAAAANELAALLSTVDPATPPGR
ncbi:carbon storage regulator CsrA [Lysinimonas soli]|uniref:Translational regulator CsrA n=1 Tax=Lysinimonas soli TaxID=1074233 RepID=A0ABW0NP54_9MICO